MYALCGNLARRCRLLRARVDELARAFFRSADRLWRCLIFLDIIRFSRLHRQVRLRSSTSLRECKQRARGLDA
jgi:hypothetical protein